MNEQMITLLMANDHEDFHVRASIMRIDSKGRDLSDKTLQYDILRALKYTEAYYDYFDKPVHYEDLDAFIKDHEFYEYDEINRSINCCLDDYNWFTIRQVDDLESIVKILEI